MASVKVWLVILSIILIYPAYYCVQGVLVTLDTANSRSNEGNILIGLMWIYSSVIWVPYFIITGQNRKKLTTTFKLICSLSSSVIFGCVVYSFVAG